MARAGLDFIASLGRFRAVKKSAAFLCLLGASIATAQEPRVSVGPGGAQADGGSFAPVISTDGRLVAFASFATNLVSGDTNGEYDVFVHAR